MVPVTISGGAVCGTWVRGHGTPSHSTGPLSTFSREMTVISRFYATQLIFVPLFDSLFFAGAATDQREFLVVSFGLLNFQTNAAMDKASKAVKR